MTADTITDEKVRDLLRTLNEERSNIAEVRTDMRDGEITPQSAANEINAAVSRIVRKANQ